MTSKKRGGLHFFGERIASWLTAAVRSSWAPVAAVSALVVAGVVGFVLGFSEKYVVVIETGISVITFLLVLFLERTQHKESQAIQVKLNEIVAALEGASNRLIGVENVTEAEMEELHEIYQKLARSAEKEDGLPRARSAGDDSKSRARNRAQVK